MTARHIRVLWETEKDMGIQDSRRQDNLSTEGKTRIVQELVPGKQITIAHLIANPDKILYEKLGFEN